jgi:transcriptional regulator with XRE-family HTH domain
MNYEKIEEVRKAKGMQKMVFYRLIDMTDSGYRRAIENKSMRIETLQRIANVLKVPISLFFEETAPVAGTMDYDAERIAEEGEAAVLQGYAGLSAEETLRMMATKITVLQVQLNMAEAMVEMLQQKIKTLEAPKKH